MDVAAETVYETMLAYRSILSMCLICIVVLVAV